MIGRHYNETHQPEGDDIEAPAPEGTPGADIGVAPEIDESLIPDEYLQVR